jgi:dihydroorotase
VIQTLTIRKPDDWHVHFRDNLFLQDTVPATAHHFARALVMPNLKPALTTVPALLAYRARILQAYPKTDFTPYMTLYLNDFLAPESLYEAAQHDFVVGAKLYPAGVTTHAEQGARSIDALYPCFEVIQQQGLVLQIHCECLEGDIFEREERFIKESLTQIIKDFPKLKIVLEHISTRKAVDFILSSTADIAATITPHHLLYNRNHLLAHGLKPHYYCLPILKRQEDQTALIQAALSGHPRFFAGTDSAPHTRTMKENACGCAGIYSAPFAIALYAEVFDKNEKLQRLNDFMSKFGADFYQKTYNNELINLERVPQQVPETLPLGKEEVVPIAAGQTLSWSIHV